MQETQEAVKLALPVGVIGGTILAVAMSIPLVWVARSTRRLTWASAILVGTWTVSIALILIGDVPSRILYYFDAEHAKWAAKASWLAFMKGDQYLLVRDVVANTVQGIFFVIVVALIYFWGEKQRKAGRFKSS